MTVLIVCGVLLTMCGIALTTVVVTLAYAYLRLLRSIQPMMAHYMTMIQSLAREVDPFSSLNLPR